MSYIIWDGTNTSISVTVPANYSGYVLVSFGEGSLARRVSYANPTAPTGGLTSLDLISCPLFPVPGVQHLPAGNIFPIHIKPHTSTQTITIQALYTILRQNCGSIASHTSVADPLDNHLLKLSRKSTHCEISHWDFDISESNNSIGITVMISDDNFGGGGD